MRPGNGSGQWRIIGDGSSLGLYSLTMPTRRYGTDEVREILALATTGDSQGRALPAESDGLTLDEDAVRLLSGTS